MFDKKTIGPSVIIVMSLMLFVINLMELKNGSSAIWGIISNILLIIAMVVVIIENKKKSNK